MKPACTPTEGNPEMSLKKKLPRLVRPSYVSHAMDSAVPARMGDGMVSKG